MSTCYHFLLPETGLGPVNFVGSSVGLKSLAYWLLSLPLGMRRNEDVALFLAWRTASTPYNLDPQESVVNFLKSPVRINLKLIVPSNKCEFSSILNVLVLTHRLSRMHGLPIWWSYIGLQTANLSQETSPACGLPIQLQGSNCITIISISSFNFSIVT